MPAARFQKQPFSASLKAGSGTPRIRMSKGRKINVCHTGLPVKLIPYYLYRMRAVIQRVTQASVTINNHLTSAINHGLLVLLGIEDADTTEDITWLSNKIVNLRIFDDENKVPNISVKDIGGDILLVSQFTLQASTKKGNRPSYIRASKGDVAIPLYKKMIGQLEIDLGKKISTGEFGADMKISLVNDGPITICIDTKNKE